MGSRLVLFVTDLRRSEFHAAHKAPHQVPPLLIRRSFDQSCETLLELKNLLLVKLDIP